MIEHTITEWALTGGPMIECPNSTVPSRAWIADGQWCCSWCGEPVKAVT